MNPQSSDKQKAQAFDSYVKKILKYAARDYYGQMKRRREREISFADLTGAELSKLAVTDKYFSDTHAFDVQGFSIGIADIDLATALSELPAEKRDIILLSYFLDMTDKEIAERLNLANSTVAYRRNSTIKNLKKIMEGYADE